METQTIHPTDKMQQIVSQEIDPDVAESLHASARELEGVFYALALETKNRPGLGTPDEVTLAIRDLCNSMFARLFSENALNPELALIVIKGATALVQPEPTADGAKSAANITKQLISRYGRTALQT